MKQSKKICPKCKRGEMIKQSIDISIQSPYAFGIEEKPNDEEIKVLNKKSWEIWKKKNNFSKFTYDESSPLNKHFELTPFCCDNCGYTEFYIFNLEPED